MEKEKPRGSALNTSEERRTSPPRLSLSALQRSVSLSFPSSAFLFSFPPPPSAFTSQQRRCTKRIVSWGLESIVDTSQPVRVRAQGAYESEAGSHFLYALCVVIVIVLFLSML